MPFDSKSNRDYEAVAAFEDTWTWGDTEETNLADLEGSTNEEDIKIAEIVNLTLKLRGQGGSDNISAYLLNMGQRLYRMKRVLKSTGSIWLHCDPTASHYLKMLMDAVFGYKNFRNEIIWHYKASALTAAEQVFPRKHDVLLFYSKTDECKFVNPRENELSEQMRNRWGKYLEPDGKTILYGSIKHEKSEEARSRKRIMKKFGREPVDDDIAFTANPSLVRSVWQIPEVRNNPKYKESLGYPTQKPIELLKRILEACSEPGDFVLDLFCGCGTTVFVAEQLERQWIGMDISRYSASLVKNRLVAAFDKDMYHNLINVYGLPRTVEEARALAKEAGPEGRFEFEKWVCGVLGTSNMVLKKNPGDRGPDGGVNGILKFFPMPPEVFHQSEVTTKERYAVIQVKSGNITADAVRALPQVIKTTHNAIAGVMVGFADQRATFENNSDGELIADIAGEYPVIQFLSIEDLLKLPEKPTYLPNITKVGGKTETILLPRTESGDGQLEFD